MYVSSKLSTAERESLGIGGPLKLRRELNAKQRGYLTHHYVMFKLRSS
jgi:hypothetical protein